MDRCSQLVRSWTQTCRQVRGQGKGPDLLDSDTLRIIISVSFPEEQHPLLDENRAHSRNPGIPGNIFRCSVPARETSMKHFTAGRPLLMGCHGMVCSGHSLASLSGVKALQEGGNAVDAALAASFVLAVVRPQACGVGGDLFALVSMKKRGKVEALNASGPAPKRATLEFFRERGLSEIPVDGPLSLAVPGIVDGWVELHSKYALNILTNGPFTSPSSRRTNPKLCISKSIFASAFGLGAVVDSQDIIFIYCSLLSFRICDIIST